MPSSEILVILLLILLNGFFALSEMALVASKRARIQAAVEQGKTGAKSALALIEDPTTLLSSIQIGITLINIPTNMYSASTLAAPLGGTLMEYGVSVTYAQDIAFGILTKEGGFTDAWAAAEKREGEGLSSFNSFRPDNLVQLMPAARDNNVGLRCQNMLQMADEAVRDEKRNHMI